MHNLFCRAQIPEVGVTNQKNEDMTGNTAHTNIGTEAGMSIEIKEIPCHYKQ